MSVRTKFFYLVLFNGACLLLIYYIFIDVQIRVSYARDIGFRLGNIYFPFTKLQILHGSVNLPSPLTLDWVQVILFALFIVDVYYLAKSRVK